MYIYTHIIIFIGYLFPFKYPIIVVDAYFPIIDSLCGVLLNFRQCHVCLILYQQP